MPVSLLLIYVYTRTLPRSMIFFGMPIVTTPLMSALFLPFFTRERYDVRFVNSILSPIFLFLDGRINEETSFKIIVSVDFGGGGMQRYRINYRAITLCYLICVKTFLCMLALLTLLRTSLFHSLSNI